MKEMDYRGMGQRIRKQRRLKQMTQEQLAEDAGISLSFLGHIERGSRKASLDTLVKICNALKISPYILLQDSLDDDLLGINSSMSETTRRMLHDISDIIQNYDARID